MLQVTFIWLGTIAFFVTAGTLVASLILQMRGGVKHSIDVLGGFVGVLLWGVWGLASTNIEVVSNGSVVSQPSTALAFIAVAMAGISLILGLLGVSSLANVLDVSPAER